MFAKRA